MIAAQLLAYYFTELKDDQVKKVSALCSSWWCEGDGLQKGNGGRRLEEEEGL